MAFAQRSNLDLVNGRVNNSPIGAVTPSSGAFTTLSSTGNNLIQGTLKTTGNMTAIDSTSLNVKDNYIYINNGYSTVAGITAGLVVNRLPTATFLSTTGAGVFTPGVAATSNPTISLSGAVAATLTTGMIVQILGATDVSNNGIFEVASNNTTTLLTLRGVGTIPAVEDFSQTQLFAETNATVTIRNINVSIIRANASNGMWESGLGTTTGISYSISGNVAMVSNGTTTNGIMKLTASGTKTIIDTTVTIDGTNQVILATGSNLKFTAAADNIQFNAVNAFPASSTDTAIVTWNTATGRAIQNSNILIDTNGNIRADTSGRHIIASFESQTVAGGAALSPDANKQALFITTSGGSAAAATGTLANGTFTNQRKLIVANSIADATRTYILTVTNALFPGAAAGARTLTFDTSGQSIDLVWNGTNWLNTDAGILVA